MHLQISYYLMLLDGQEVLAELYLGSPLGAHVVFGAHSEFRIPCIPCDIHVILAQSPHVSL